jgi:hypothetical protein
MFNRFNVLTTLFLCLAVFSNGNTASASSVLAKPEAAPVNSTVTATPDEFSSSWRGRRNTAIALGIAAGVLGAAAFGAYPYYYPYPHYGYYGPAYPYYGPAAVYVRPRKVRCWVYDPYRGVRYRTYCYR